MQEIYNYPLYTPSNVATLSVVAVNVVIELVVLLCMQEQRTSLNMQRRTFQHQDIDHINWMKIYLTLSILKERGHVDKVNT